MSISKGSENRTPASISHSNDFTDGDARREVESSRHVKEPHVVVPPLESQDMQSDVPVAHVGVDHVPSKNTLVDILEHSQADALDEAANRKHAASDRARSGGSTIVK
jgi:hypothetical protein